MDAIMYSILPSEDFFGLWIADYNAFYCSLLLLCHCYPCQGLTEKGVVPNIITKMCFFDLHVSSNTQPSIFMRNHKNLTESSIVEIKKQQNSL